MPLQNSLHQRNQLEVVYVTVERHRKLQLSRMYKSQAGSFLSSVSPRDKQLRKHSSLRGNWSEQGTHWMSLSRNLSLYMYYTLPKQHWMCWRQKSIFHWEDLDLICYRERSLTNWAEYIFWRDIFHPRIEKGENMLFFLTISPLFFQDFTFTTRKLCLNFLWIFVTEWWSCTAKKWSG